MSVGDRISVRADMPPEQAAHYLLVVAFLRGSTNPPPDRWFFKSETWKHRDHDGLSLIVPPGAEQVAMFLAPETGGDFPTLRDAVKGRPGAFVRAAQELAQASLDRSRLDTYLAAVRKTVPGDPDRLTRITPLLARSLQIKVNSDCLIKMPSLQVACLLQNQESLVLNDGHSNAITDAVSGPGTDLALQLSATPQAGLGYYSPYIAAIRDIVSILSSLHTAKYQYIPALATLDGDRMDLALNAAPSFHNPKSVLVAALPIVAPTHIPPLQIPEVSPSLCRQTQQPLLPMTGAPLIYATRYAHDLNLRVSLSDGSIIDLPATPDAERGGLLIDMGRMPNEGPTSLQGHLRGEWGFQSFDGPAVILQTKADTKWQSASDAKLTAGANLVLSGGSAACVTDVTATSGAAGPVKLTWRKTAPNEIGVTIPADNAAGRRMSLSITGPTGSSPDIITLGVPKPPTHLSAAVTGRSLQLSTAPGPMAITLTDAAEVPNSATLTFSLRLDGTQWTDKMVVEIAPEHGGAVARLRAGGGIVLLDDHVAIVSLQPETLLGESAFGTLRGRIVGDGAASDWLPLGTLVRLPAFVRLSCDPDPASPCRLLGKGLYLLNSVAATPSFEKAVDVPAGYPAATLDVPHPIGGDLYVRLHDAPDIANRLTL